MNKSILLLLLPVLACNQTAKQNKTENEKQQQEPIFPVTSFIQGQLYLLDSLQLPTVKYTNVNGQKDSALISIEECKQIAQEFFQPDINDPGLRDYYTETNFADQSIKSVTFTYATEDPNMEIRRLDVVITASPTASDKVRSIFIEKESKHNDTTFFKKLYWRADKNFQIITNKQPGNKHGIIHVIKVEWDKE